ncbi:MAG: Rne/Rng family ribonuclease, partial [Propionibacteriaceae bacterium]|nr:Rne/Rng family ribonuclease [Propionibacteriaceae bacterium]
MLDSDAPSGTPADSTESTTPAPRRRRRAASRPAGPPRAIDPTPAPVEIAPVSEPESVEAEWSEVPIDAPVVESPPEPVTEESDAVEPAEGEATAEVEGSIDAAEAEVDSELAEAIETPAQDEAGQDEAEPEPEPEPAAAPKRRTTRRRGRKADAEASTEAPADGSDPVAEGLAQLSAERGEAAPAAAETQNDSTDVSAALNDLAAAIGGAKQGSGTDDNADAGEDAAADGADQADKADEEDKGDQETDNDGEDDDATPRRRRRRRGGRRRRRGSDAEDDSDSDSDSDDESGSQADSEASEDESSDNEQNDEASESTSSGRRRRRRRRRGEDTGAEAEDGVDVVVKVREPRASRSKSSNDEITSIEGSTRMEAKRQRRREGRAAGRRRSPVLSEAEFLARRESVERQMLIRQADDYTQIAVLEDGILVEHYVDRDSSASMIGNIYVGRVQNVLPSMEAAFIDIGRGRNAVLYAGEVDWESFGVTGDDRKVEKVLKSGQSILVQVTKDPIGAKGARLTAHISIPGRYVVYCPGGQLSGISRKLPENERARLKGILDDAVGDQASVIVRTAAEGAAAEELERDVNRLKTQWEVIEKKVKSGSAPQQLYTEPDLTVRIVRDLFTEDFSALVVDGNGQGEDAWEAMEAYVTHVAPHLSERLRRWDRATEGDIFDTFRVHEQVAKALERKVHLPSGGSLVIDRTEAMTVIDVNTGKFTGSQGNLEATVTSNNLEAAEEVVRQLRLRDIGGIIVIDFIDMVLPANRELLLRRLVECLGRDRTRHQVAEVTSLGLVQMTRKRIGTGLAEAFTVSCETCAGRGYHVHDAPVASQAPADGGDRDGGRRNSRSRGGRSRNARQDTQNQDNQ